MTAICAQRPSRLTASTDPNSPWRWSASASLDARFGRTFAVPGRCWKAGVVPNPAVRAVLLAANASDSADYDLRNFRGRFHDLRAGCCESAQVVRGRTRRICACSADLEYLLWGPPVVEMAHILAPDVRRLPHGGVGHGQRLDDGSALPSLSGAAHRRRHGQTSARPG
jgi:hypothetical protein